MANEFNVVGDLLLDCGVYQTVEVPEGSQFLGMKLDAELDKIVVWYLRPGEVEKMVAVEFLTFETWVECADIRGRYLGSYQGAYKNMRHVFVRELVPEEY